MEENVSLTVPLIIDGILGKSSYRKSCRFLKGYSNLCWILPGVLPLFGVEYAAESGNSICLLQSPTDSRLIQTCTPIFGTCYEFQYVAWKSYFFRLFLVFIIVNSTTLFPTILNLFLTLLYHYSEIWYNKQATKQANFSRIGLYFFAHCGIIHTRF